MRCRVRHSARHRNGTEPCGTPTRHAFIRGVTFLCPCRASELPHTNPILCCTFLSYICRFIASSIVLDRIVFVYRVTVTDENESFYLYTPSDVFIEYNTGNATPIVSINMINPPRNQAYQ